MNQTLLSVAGLPGSEGGARSPREERRGSPVSAASTAATSPVLSEEGALVVDEMLVDRQVPS